MVQAISGISATSSASSAGGSVIAIQTQIDQCNGKLSDWISCPSGKTPEGKKIIENLQTRIGELKSRLAAANDGSVRSQSLLGTKALNDPQTEQQSNNPANAAAVGSVAASGSISGSSTNIHSANLHLSNKIDLYA